MDGNNYEIHARAFITKAYCKCGTTLAEVSDGWLSKAMYCPKCENVYKLKLIKVPAKRITKKYLLQCRQETMRRSKNESA